MAGGEQNSIPILLIDYSFQKLRCLRFDLLQTRKYAIKANPVAWNYELFRFSNNILDPNFSNNRAPNLLTWFLECATVKIELVSTTQQLQESWNLDRSRNFYST